nr:hypothetical protein [uncultured bacterium]
MLLRRQGNKPATVTVDQQLQAAALLAAPHLGDDDWLALKTQVGSEHRVHGECLKVVAFSGARQYQRDGTLDRQCLCE